MLKDRGIAISMDGKGAWRDNVFVERFWRSLKYEEVYLRAYESAMRSQALHRPLYYLLQSRDRPCIRRLAARRRTRYITFNQPTQKAA